MDVARIEYVPEPLDQVKGNSFYIGILIEHIIRCFLAELFSVQLLMEPLYKYNTCCGPIVAFLVSPFIELLLGRMYCSLPGRCFNLFVSPVYCVPFCVLDPDILKSLHKGKFLYMEAIGDL